MKKLQGHRKRTNGYLMKNSLKLLTWNGEKDIPQNISNLELLPGAQYPSSLKSRRPSIFALAHTETFICTLTRAQARPLEVTVV